HQNLGFSKANNQGISIAQGKYLLLLNSDTIVKKGSLEKMVEFAEAHHDAGVVGPRLLNADGSIQPSCFNFPSVLGAIKEFWLGKKGSFTKWAPKGKQPVEVDAVVGAAFLITPQARKKVGLLDERYFFYFEDIDYCRRVWRAGLKVYYFPQAEIIHLHGASGKKLKQKPNQWLIASSKIYYGWWRYYLINSIIWLGQKYEKLFRRIS
ncbi:glycosyltransferase family 2 protein, partial [bacterium]|nr:glycosyltransferase family 2 protein [bacterium]